MSDNKYQSGKIYKITDNAYTKCYIGSTCEKYLSNRMGGHRVHYKAYKNGKRHLTSSFLLFDEFGVENCKIELIEIYPCNSKQELNAREGFYIKNIDCINKCIPGRTGREYREANKNKIKEQKRKYREANKNKIKDQKRKYYEANKDKIKEQKRKYCEANKNKMKDVSKRYREANKNKIKERNRKYREANKDKIKEQKRKYYEAKKNNLKNVIKCE